MKRIAIAAALAFACAAGAQAAGPRSWVGLVGGGLTFGGEKLATVEYEDDDDDDDDNKTRDIRSGNLVYIYTGVEYRFSRLASIQATIGCHIDNASGDNGSVRFTRYPLELLVHFHVSESMRLGGGFRTALNPSLSGSGVANSIDNRFKNSTGGVLEVEYLVTPEVGVKVRGVAERYKSEGSGGTVDGNHIGILGTYYF